MKPVKRNQKLHNPNLPLLIGDVKRVDVVKRLMNLVSLTHNKNYFKLKYIQLYYFPSSRLISKIIWPKSEMKFSSCLL